MRVRVPQACHPLFTLLATKFGRTRRKRTEKSVAILLTCTMFRQNLDYEQSFILSRLAVSPLVDSQSQIARFPPLSQRKITTARSLEKIKLYFLFNPICVVLATYFACFLFSGEGHYFFNSTWEGPPNFRDCQRGEGHNF